MDHGAETPWFDEVRFTLHSEPSPEGWARLCELLDEVTQGDQPPWWLDYVTSALDAGWPDDLRHARPHWLDGLPDAAPWHLAAARAARLSGIDRERLLNICNTATLSHLTHLNLEDNSISLRTLWRLMASPTLSGLRQLGLAHNRLGTGALVGADEPVLLRSLQALDLSDNGIDFEGIQHIATHPALAQLTALDLSDNELGFVGATVVALSPHLALLTHLNLANNRVNDDGALAIARSSSLRRLRHLDLTRNPISGVGARALAAAPWLADTLVLLDDEPTDPRARRPAPDEP